jgi:hypothetical protein
MRGPVGEPGSSDQAAMVTMAVARTMKNWTQFRRRSV